MIRIERDQLDQMLSNDERMLRQAIRRQVESDYPALVQGLPEDLLEQMIEAGLNAARGYGLQDPSSLAGFVYVMFEVGPGFHTHPAVRSVLTDTAIPPEKRLDAVFERTAPAVWDEIALELSRQRWFPDERGQ